MSVETAAAEVAIGLGKSTASEVAVIRTGYYEASGRELGWSQFFNQFLEWREWIFAADERTLRLVLNDHQKQFGELQSQNLARLMGDIREDRKQRALNRLWRLEPGEEQRRRIHSGGWNPESDWQFLAIDLWSLGRLHASIGDTDEAKSLLGRALSLWKTHGHRLPHAQAEAIADLRGEIAQMSLRQDLPSRRF